MTVPVALAPLSSAEDQHASYSWKNLTISIWFGASTLDALLAHDAQLEAFCARHPQHISSINLVLPGHFALPSPEVRVEYERFVQKYAEDVVASALVLLGNGFWASAVRGAATAVTMLSRRDLKPHIFRTARQAADWLAPVHLERTGVAIDASELAALVESSVRAHTRQT